MTDKRIDPEVIEAAAKASWESIDEMVSLREGLRRHPWDTLPPEAHIEHRRHAEAAIRAADRERGLRRVLLPADWARRGDPERWRLLSDWRQVERGGEDG